jgi:4-hydroxybutyrate CoA-transferase
MNLHLADSLDADFEHTTCVVAGSHALYRHIDEIPQLAIAPCHQTHDPRTLSGYTGFVAVNSALEVDLFGQCNFENLNGRVISGPGGAPDFSRAARLSPGGASIVALRARHKYGSRIVARLCSPSVVTVPRVDVDYIVTEFGIADLRNVDVDVRARRLMDVAAPESRAELLDSWGEILRHL